MREILFRAKRIDNGEWVEGDLINLPKNNMSIVECGFFTVKSSITVNPETLGQYTGLRDSEGNKIFEGDICNVLNYASDYMRIRGKMSCVIEWNESLCGFYGRGFGIPTGFAMGEEFKVIGNKFDNPELLERKQYVSRN